MKFSNNNEDTFNAAVEHANDIHKHWFSLGTSLSILRAEGIDLFRRLLEESKLSRKDAERLIRLNRLLSCLSDEDQIRLKKVGWSKLKEIIGHANNLNIRDLLEFAEAHTSSEIRRNFRKIPYAPGSRTVMLYLEPEEYEYVMLILGLFGAEKLTDRLYTGKEFALLSALRELAKLAGRFNSEYSSSLPKKDPADDDQP